MPLTASHVTLLAGRIFRNSGQTLFSNHWLLVSRQRVNKDRNALSVSHLTGLSNKLLKPRSKILAKI